MCEIDWSAIAIVGATILGPVLAVWASEIRQRHRQGQDRKEWVFRTLMTTRSNRRSVFIPNKFGSRRGILGMSDRLN